MHRSAPYHGLVAAPHTPFDAQGELALARVEVQCEHLSRDGVAAVFVAGTTGEGLSLTFEERRDLARRWCDAARGTGVRVLVHVGGNRAAESAALSREAHEAGADGVAALAPSFFRPTGAEELARWYAPLAAAAPELPFYIYELPTFTQVTVSTPELVERLLELVPTFRGVKYTRPELDVLQHLLALEGGALDVLYGNDEALLAGLALGARGAVGSTYNFAAPLYHRLIAAFERGDLAAARVEQLRSVELVWTIARHGYLGAAKAVMAMIGVDCGAPRPPIAALDAGGAAELEGELRALGFFEWGRA